MIFKSEFPDKFGELVANTASFNDGCQILTKNEEFKKFLKVSLDLGNTLNAVNYLLS